MKKIAVVGLGNVLMKDDGAGTQVIEQLEKDANLSPDVTLIRGETVGISILPYLEGAEVVIFIDAVIFDGEYGEVKVFKEEEIGTNRVPHLFQRTLRTVHELGLEDIVSLIKLHFHSQPEIVLIGIKPRHISTGLEMSAEVEGAIPVATAMVKDEIRVYADRAESVR